MHEFGKHNTWAGGEPPHKYVVEVFHPACNGVECWHKTNWGSDDLEKTLKHAQEIADHANPKFGFTKVRVVDSHAWEIIDEFELHDIPYEEWLELRKTW